MSRLSTQDLTYSHNDLTENRQTTNLMVYHGLSSSVSHVLVLFKCVHQFLMGQLEVSHGIPHFRSYPSIIFWGVWNPYSYHMYIEYGRILLYSIDLLVSYNAAPLSIHLNRTFHYEPSILRHPHEWQPSC